jgi:hypothetical protein
MSDFRWKRGSTHERYKVQGQLLSLGISGRVIYLNLSFEQGRRNQAVAPKVGTYTSERDEESLIF